MFASTSFEDMLVRLDASDATAERASLIEGEAATAEPASPHDAQVRGSALGYDGQHFATQIFPQRVIQVFHRY